MEARSYRITAIVKGQRNLADAIRLIGTTPTDAIVERVELVGDDGGGGCSGGCGSSDLPRGPGHRGTDGLIHGGLLSACPLCVPFGDDWQC